MANDKNYIKKLKLSDGSLYYMYDVDAAHAADMALKLDKSGGEITGNLTVDNMLSTKNLKVTEVDDVSVAVTNVLTQTSDGTIKKRSADDLLEDIGGISYSMDTTTGVLTFKYGRQPKS